MHASWVTTRHKTIGPVLKPSQLGNRWLAACSFKTILSSHLLCRIQEVKFNLFVCVGWKFTSSKCKGQFRWTPHAAWWHIRLGVGGLTLYPEPCTFRFIKKQRTLYKTKSENYFKMKHCFAKCARSCSYLARNFRLADTLKTSTTNTFAKFHTQLPFWDKSLLFAKRLCWTYYVGTL